jgi:hypothetical protein
MRNLHVLPAIAISLVSIGCSKPIARVGRYEITSRDAELRREVALAFYPDLKEKSVGAQQLISAFTTAEILASRGMDLSDAALEREAARIDSSTRDPERLERIKAIFGRNRAAYLKDFILPTLVERSIYFDYFRNDPSLRDQALERPRAMIERVRSGKRGFAEAAKDLGVKPIRVSVTRSEGFRMDGEKPEPAGAGAENPRVTEMRERMKQATLDEAARWIEGLLSKLKRGETFAEPVPYFESWAALRLDRVVTKGTSYRVTLAVFPPADFQKWFDEAKRSVKVEILDPASFGS